MFKWQTKQMVTLIWVEILSKSAFRPNRCFCC